MVQMHVQEYNTSTAAQNSIFSLIFGFGPKGKLVCYFRVLMQGCYNKIDFDTFIYVPNYPAIIKMIKANENVKMYNRIIC